MSEMSWVVLLAIAVLVVVLYRRASTPEKFCRRYQRLYRWYQDVGWRFGSDRPGFREERERVRQRCVHYCGDDDRTCA